MSLVSLVSELPANHERVNISSGYNGTAETIRRMGELVTASKRDFRIRTFVGNLISSCPKKDYYCYAKACFEFCRDEIQYAFDPNGVELIENPVRILESRVADCDSICVLLASMLENLGLPCRYVTIKADSKRPDEFSHIYLEVKIPHKGWIPADATMSHQFGWEPSKEFPRTYWKASEDDMESHDSDDTTDLKISGLSGFTGEFLDTDGAVAAQEDEIELNDLKVVKGTSMANLGVEADPGVITILSDIIDGNYKNDLLTIRSIQRERTGKLQEALNKANSTGDIVKAANIQKAYTLNNQALQATNQAISKYNEVLTAIQTYSMGSVKIPQLVGLGLAPVAIAGIAVAGGITIATLCYSLADLVRAAKGMESKSKSLSDNIVGGLEAIGGITQWLVIGGIIAAVIYFGGPAIKKLQGAKA